MTAGSAYDAPDDVRKDSGERAWLLEDGEGSDGGHVPRGVVETEFEFEDAATATPKQLRQYGAAFSLTTFGIGPVFGCVVTYISYQVQQCAYKAVGHHPGMPPMSGCPDLDRPCRVPFGRSDVNLTSLILYLTAIGYAVSGSVTLLICGWGDHINQKREQYIGMIVLYGALALPAAGLTAYSMRSYTALTLLFTAFSIVGHLTMAWMNIFIPYTMQAAAREPPAGGGNDSDNEDDPNDELRRALAEKAARDTRERTGIAMSVWGGVSMSTSMGLLLFLTLLLSRLSEGASRNAGLYMTSASGALCIGCGLAALRYLPNPRAVPFQGSFWMLPFKSFMTLLGAVSKYQDAFRFMLAYTVYNDSHFAFNAVIVNLFNLSIRPGLGEYTGYSIVGTVTSIAGGLGFLYVFPRSGISLRSWSLACYAVTVGIAVWCCVGMISASPIGFKHRAEFYLFQVVQNLVSSALNPAFRVLFSQMFPRGREIQFFGFQLVLSSSTVWIPQVINGPIVDATNNQRLPALVALLLYTSAFLLTWHTDDERATAQIRREDAARTPVVPF